MADCDAMLRPASILLAAALAAVALLGPWSSARAQVSCAISSAVGPSFGGYDTLRHAPTDSAGFVSFRCEGVGPSTRS